MKKEDLGFVICFSLLALTMAIFVAPAPSSAQPSFLAEVLFEAGEGETVSDITVDGAGNVHFIKASGATYIIEQIATDGTIGTVAGGGTAVNVSIASAIPGDSFAASDADIGSFTSLEATEAGSIIFRRPAFGMMWRYDPDGTINRHAGILSGLPGSLLTYAGEGGPAIDATFKGRSGQEGVALGPDGSIYFKDSKSILRIDPDGIVTTFGGNGTQSFAAGDGGPVTDAGIELLGGLTMDSGGNLYLASDESVRKVGTDGIIDAVAGLRFGPEVSTFSGEAALEYGIEGILTVEAAPGNGRSSGVSVWDLRRWWRERLHHGHTESACSDGDHGRHHRHRGR
jgi:hypothetical protein